MPRETKQQIIDRLEKRIIQLEENATDLLRQKLNAAKEAEKDALKKSTQKFVSILSERSMDLKDWDSEKNQEVVVKAVPEEVKIILKDITIEVLKNYVFPPKNGNSVSFYG